jgi:hypothetical protein
VIVVYTFVSVYCWLSFGVWSARHLSKSCCLKIQELFGPIFQPRWNRRLLARYHCEVSTHANAANLEMSIYHLQRASGRIDVDRKVHASLAHMSHVYRVPKPETMRATSRLDTTSKLEL